MPDKLVQALQLITIGCMWIFTIAVLTFVPWLVFVAARWQDALNWSLVIAIVFLPVYIFVAVTLSYVYFGLRRGRQDGKDSDSDA